MNREERYTVLVVEDDPVTAKFLCDNLTADGFDVLYADCIKDGFRLAETKFPDLALFDVNLEDGSGLSLLAKIRTADRVASKVDPGLPVIMLSGNCAELDRVRGFEYGCDDYLGKPYSYTELKARMKALLRRVDQEQSKGRLRVGNLTLDVTSREVKLGEQKLALSQKEFSLLRVMIADPTRVFTKRELLRAVWGYEAVGSTRTLDSHACRLRRKLGIEGDYYISNVWGVGYRLLNGAAQQPTAQIQESR